MALLGEGGPLSSEDTVSDGFSPARALEDGFVCSDNSIDRGIFFGRKFPGDDEVEFLVPEMTS